MAVRQPPPMAEYATFFFARKRVCARHALVHVISTQNDKQVFLGREGIENPLTPPQPPHWTASSLAVGASIGLIPGLPASTSPERRTAMTTDCIEINGRRRTIPNWIDNGLARAPPARSAPRKPSRPMASYPINGWDAGLIHHGGASSDAPDENPTTRRPDCRRPSDAPDPRAATGRVPRDPVRDPGNHRCYHRDRRSAGMSPTQSPQSVSSSAARWHEPWPDAPAAIKPSPGHL